MQAAMGDRVDDATTLRLLMAWLDLRPGELARALGMTPGAVAHWMSGRTWISSAGSGGVSGVICGWCGAAAVEEAPDGE